MNIEPLTMRDYGEAFKVWRSCEGIGLTNTSASEAAARK